MENFILGFESDLSRYPMRDIWSWILAIGLLHLVIGRFIEKKSITKDYFHLIRYAALKKWWLRLGGEVLLLCMSGTMVLFIVSAIFAQAENVLGMTIVAGAYILCFAHITLFSFITILIINCWNGEKISFAAVMIVEIFSLYGGILSPAIACYLPGSLAMYRRSSWYISEGFPAMCLLAAEIVLASAIFLFGYKTLARGAKIEK